MREIVTLQLGGYANYVGAHYWNIQDEYLASSACDTDSDQEISTDILFREGVTEMGHATYTPRLVVLDRKGALGCMPLEGFVYGSSAFSSSSSHYEDVATTWKGNVAVVRQEPVPKNAFLKHVEEECAYEEEEEEEEEEDRMDTGDDDEDVVMIAKKKIKEEKKEEKEPVKKPRIVLFDENVKSWTDYLRCGFHKRTCHVIHGAHADDFDSFTNGMNLYKDHTEEFETIEDNLRWFVEDCDCLDMLQLFADDHSSFSYATTQILRNISDEYPKVPITVFSMSNGFQQQQQEHNDDDNNSRNVKSIYDLRRSVHYSQLYPDAAVIVPLSMPILSKSSLITLSSNPSHYYLSAIHAPLIDTCTLPTRLNGTHYRTPKQWTNTTTASSATCKLLSASSWMPLPIQTGQSLSSILDNSKGIHDTYRPFDYLSGLNGLEATSCAAASVSCRGVPQEAIKNGEYHQTAVSSWYRYTHGSIVSSRLCCEVVKQPLNIPVSFPHVFAPSVGRYGQAAAAAAAASSNNNNGEIVTVPHVSILHSDNSTGKFLTDAAKLLSSPLKARSVLGSVEAEDISEIRDCLHDIASQYEGGDFDD